MALAVALLALLVALFTLVALVAVYARVRQLEAGRAVELSWYASLIGQVAPPAVHPTAPDELAVVAVLDDACVLCRAVWSELGVIADELPDAPARLVGVVDRTVDSSGFPPHDRVELLADVAVRAELFEGYSPTLLTVDGAGQIGHRSFVYQDTDIHGLLLDLVKAAAPQGRRA
jgi:hypothetical protein